MKEFPQQGWKRGSLVKLLKKIQETGSVEQKVGSGRPVTSRTVENIDAVNDC